MFKFFHEMLLGVDGSSISHKDKKAKLKILGEVNIISYVLRPSNITSFVIIIYSFTSSASFLRVPTLSSVDQNAGNIKIKINPVLRELTV